MSSTDQWTLWQEERAVLLCGRLQAFVFAEKGAWQIPYRCAQCIPFPGRKRGLGRYLVSPKCGMCRPVDLALKFVVEFPWPLIPKVNFSHTSFQSLLYLVISPGEEKITSILVCVCLSLSHVQLFVIPWTVVRQAPLSMGFSTGKSTGVGCHFFSRVSSWPRYRTQVSCISDRFFPIWVTSELGEALTSILRFCDYLLYSTRRGEERSFMIVILWESEPLMLNLPIFKKKIFFFFLAAPCGM